MDDNKTAERLLIWVLFIAISVIVFTSCGTKKKTVERSKTEIVNEVKERTATIDTNAIKRDLSEVRSSEAVTVKENEIVQIEADNDTVSVEKKGDKLIVTGASKITIGRQKESTTSKDTTSTEIKETENSKTEKETVKESEMVIKQKKRATDSEVTRWPTWIYFIFVVVLLLIGWGVYKRLSL